MSIFELIIDNYYSQIKLLHNQIVMFSKRDNYIKYSLKRYLNKTGRVSLELKDLVQLLKLQQNFNYLTKFLQTAQTIPHMFKILILLNRLLLEKSNEERVIGELINGLKWQGKGKLEQVLEKKLILPYKLYLQKRAVSKINGFYGKEKMESEVRVFQLINLLNMGAAFSDIIYTFGRYYLDQYGWAVDFNITIGADLQIVYQNMVDNVKRPASKAILEEIQTLHEKLYVVFYNCYFHKYLKHYVPKWVITDVPATPRKDTNKSTRANSTSKVRAFSSQGKSLLSTASSKNISSTKKVMYSSSTSNTPLGDSCLFLNNEVDEVENVELQDELAGEKEDEMRSKLRLEQSFSLLRSMERVVQMFTQ